MAEAQNQSIGTNKHAASLRKLMFLSEGIYFLNYFLSGLTVFFSVSQQFKFINFNLLAVVKCLRH